MSRTGSIYKAWILAVLLSMAFVSNAYAAGWVTADVVKSQVISNGQLGGCLVEVTPNFSSLGLSACNNKWVTFDCASRGSTPKDAAMRLFDSAMMAYLLGRQARIFISDVEIIDGFCLGRRVVVMPEPTP